MKLLEKIKNFFTTKNKDALRYFEVWDINRNYPLAGIVSIGKEDAKQFFNREKNAMLDQNNQKEKIPLVYYAIYGNQEVFDTVPKHQLNPFKGNILGCLVSINDEQAKKHINRRFENVYFTKIGREEAFKLQLHPLSALNLLIAEKTISLPDCVGTRTVSIFPAESKGRKSCFVTLSPYISVFRKKKQKQEN